MTGGAADSFRRPGVGRVAVAFASLLACLVLLGAIAHEVGEQEPIPLDASATAWLHGLASPALDAFMTATTNLGSTPVVATLLIAAVVALLRAGRRGASVFLVASIAGSVVLDEVLKVVFHRPRPTLAWSQPLPEFSFPSGHAMNSLVFYLALALVGWAVSGRRVGERALAGAGVLALLIGISRIYLGYHWLSDVVGGYLVGVLWLCAVAAAWQVGESRIRWAPQPLRQGRRAQGHEARANRIPSSDPRPGPGSSEAPR